MEGFTSEEITNVIGFVLHTAPHADRIVQKCKDEGERTADLFMRRVTQVIAALEACRPESFPLSLDRLIRDVEIAVDCAAIQLGLDGVPSKPWDLGADLASLEAAYSPEEEALWRAAGIAQPLQRERIKAAAALIIGLRADDFAAHGNECIRHLNGYAPLWLADRARSAGLGFDTLDDASLFHALLGIYDRTAAELEQLLCRIGSVATH